jgi:hypothetical protein
MLSAYFLPSFSRDREANQESTRALRLWDFENAPKEDTNWLKYTLARREIYELEKSSTPGRLRHTTSSCSWLRFQMAKNQSRCVTLLSARESIVFLGKIAIANVKQSGGSLAHTNKLDRQPVECHLENSRKSRYQLIYQLSEKAGSKV